MIQVYEKNGLFIIEDTCIDVIYPNLTRDEAIEKLKKHRRDADRVDYPITDIKEDEFKYDSLEASIEYVKYIKQQLAEKDKEIEELRKKIKIISNVNDSFLYIIQDRKDFNEVVNEVLLQVKPIRLRKQIANDFFLLIAAKEQKIRKQVCDEIRNVIHYKCEWYEQKMMEEDLLKEIDEIEQGE